MWEQLNRTDIEHARQKLLELRAITLRRHEEELKQLDADEAELETLERLLAVVTAKYLNPGRTPSLAVAPAEESPVPAALAEEPPRPEAHSDAASPQMEQSVSPNFGIPLRRFVRRRV
jgi:hypothetical protein